MKLSEAIRLGIGAVKEDRGSWHGCAIGTALFAVGKTGLIHKHWDGLDALQEVWPWTEAPSTYHYVRGKSCSSLAHEISFRHCSGESREALAAFIATIEPPDVAVPVVAETREEHVLGR